MRRKELKWKYPAEYGVWNMMKQRCSNPNTSRYNAYGGRDLYIYRSILRNTDISALTGRYTIRFYNSLYSRWTINTGGYDFYKKRLEEVKQWDTYRYTTNAHNTTRN